MARGLIISTQTKTTSQLKLTSIPRVSLPTKPSIRYPFASINLRFFPSNRLLCSYSSGQHDPINISKYKETFAKRMSMAGLKPHHRIALGVSGGPDSMALCVLAAAWKTDDLNAVEKEGSQFIDGLLAIIVDHGLRAESKDEANTVCHRVLDMGIRCEIVRCEWLDGRPKQGHLQKAARDMRYQNFQNVCIQHQIGVLLTAHHADDQAELFILRLSRKSGVLGLAGMAFTTQLFIRFPNSNGETSSSQAILLVRPLLEFSKEDMYKICQGANQEWVEDPTNRSPLFARNRIRMSLKNMSSSIFKSELHAVISACRSTRLHVDQVCHNLITQAVTIMPQGYAVISLESLNPSKIKDICLSKFVALVLQFISQRHRPVRGSASKLLLDYIRSFPCKTSLTAAGCYLCPAPGSKGIEVLVCCSVDSSLPSNMELFHTHSYEEGQYCCIPSEVEKIVVDGKLYSDQLVPDAENVHFLDVISSECVLTEAKRFSILSESTYWSIHSLQNDEIEHFKSVSFESNSKNEVASVNTTLSNALHAGQIGYFMNRFLVTWKMKKRISFNTDSGYEAESDHDLGAESKRYCCSSCLVGHHDMVVVVRHMIDADWLYLVELSKCQNVEKFHQRRVFTATKTEEVTEKINICSNYVKLSARRALLSLKSIPVSARRGLPVLVNPRELLLSIPSIGFERCPCMMVSAVFKPIIPLGGGYSSFI